MPIDFEQWTETRFDLLPLVDPRGHVSAFALLFALATSCADAVPEPDGFSVTDSAGIRIVESTTPAWSEPERWLVDPTPSFNVGGLDSEVWTSRGMPFGSLTAKYS